MSSAQFSEKGRGRMLVWRPGLFLVPMLVILLAQPASSNTIDEAALRIALRLIQASDCHADGTQYAVASLPAEDESQILTGSSLDVLGADFLEALLGELPACIEISEVTSALNSLSYIQSIGQWEEVGGGLRAEIQEHLSGVDGVLALTVVRDDEDYIAIVEVTSLEDGVTIANVSFDVPIRFTSQNCGSSATSEFSGLENLSTALVERLSRAEGFGVALATYQRSEHVTSYGQYITEQFIAALSEATNNPITDRAISVRGLSDIEQAALNQDQHAVILRYWPCPDSASVRLSVTATSGTGEQVVLGHTLSLLALPAGLEVFPQEQSDEVQPDSPETPQASSMDEQSLDTGQITVRPRLANDGDVLSISAEPPSNCAPFFFDLSDSGQLTPLPLDIFDISETRPGLIRYVNNSGSRYGIIVQPDDEPGIHRLGYVCQPSDISSDGIRDVFRQLREEFLERRTGVIVVGDSQVLFNSMTYEILR